MFESDDFDQILIQFDLPEFKSPESEINKKSTTNCAVADKLIVEPDSVPKINFTYGGSLNKLHNLKPLDSPVTFDTKHSNHTYSNCQKSKNRLSPTHSKRKIIHSHFDHCNKRKFPGPAGLLTGTLETSDNSTDGCVELLSQDIDFSQNYLRKELFESPLWSRLLDDVKSWELHPIDPIKAIKEQALAGNLQRRKAQTVTAFVETVDRSATDPLVILRDGSGSIKCTLHRDAWSTFSPYIVSDYCAIVLWKPTVLTTGSAFKKHYLNITLSNIYAIYSSAVLKDEDRPFPEGYILLSDEDITVIKTDKSPQCFDINSVPANGTTSETSELMDGLDSIFSDDLL